MSILVVGSVAFDDVTSPSGSVKNILGGSINGIAAIYFIWHNMVHWPYVAIMGIGSIAGGFTGAHLARRIGRPMVRKIVIAVGFAMAVSLFLKR